MMEGKEKGVGEGRKGEAREIGRGGRKGRREGVR